LNLFDKDNQRLSVEMNSVFEIASFFLVHHHCSGTTFAKRSLPRSSQILSRARKHRFPTTNNNNNTGITDIHTPIIRDSDPSYSHFHLPIVAAQGT